MNLQRCQQQHHGAVDYGIRMQNFVSQLHRGCDSVPAVLQAMQNAQTRLHRVETASQNDVHFRTISHHHNGSASEGNPGLLRLPGG